MLYLLERGGDHIFASSEIASPYGVFYIKSLLKAKP